MLPQIVHRILYGLISGVSEFLGVSSCAHQMIYRQMFGFEPNDPWLTVCTFAGMLASILFCYRIQIQQLLRENKLSKPSRRRKSHPPEQRALLTLRICKTVLFPVVLSVLFYGLAIKWVSGFHILTLTLAANGVILFIPRIVSSGNKDCLSMTRLDSIFMGLSGSLGVIPGFSRVGCISAVASARGTLPSFAVDLALLISVIPLSLILAISFIGAFLSHTVMNSLMVIGDILALLSSFGGGCLGIWFIRSICNKTSISVFSYYSWGIAMIALALYMII